MILHTIVPQELIFQSSVEQSGEMAEMIFYDGIPLVVESVDGSSYRINKILSTDPNHFLRADIVPGQVIQLWN